MAVLAWLLLAGAAADVVVANEQTERPAYTSADDAQPRTIEEVRRLVAQLGSQDYHAREAASNTLVTLGPAVVPFLEEAAQSPVLEIHTRAERLLAIVVRESFEQEVQAFLADVDGRRGTTLPGWDRARLRLAETDDARRLFAEMYRTEPALFEAYGEDNAKAAAAFGLRVDELHDQQYQRSRTNYRLRNQLQQATSANVMALLFVGADAELELPHPLVARFRTMFVQAWPAPRVQAAPEREYIREWLAEWILHQFAQPQREYESIVLGMQYDVPQVLQLALDVLRQGETHYYSRTYAASCIGKYGQPWHLSLVESLLTDQTSVNQPEHRINNRAVRLETQVRDVALAVLLQRTGQEPREYGFADLDTSVDYIHLLQSVAFESAQKRAGAFAKWNEWRQQRSLFEGEPPHPAIAVEIPDAGAPAPAPQ
jgi:hypothetical protein